MENKELVAEKGEGIATERNRKHFMREWLDLKEWEREIFIF